MWKKIVFSSILFLLFAYLLNSDCFTDYWLPPLPEIDSNKIWTNKNEVDDSIRPINIKVPENILYSLRDKLINRTISPSLPESNFRYGFNSVYLETLIQHWLTKYIWQNWEDRINSFPHYFTNINGLQIHFIHIRPTLKPGQRSLPILLLHGWPGSFFEFYKVIPMLIDTEEKIAFEVICPSLPGFGWSDASEKPGFGLSAMSTIMFKLMERLNITEKFYIQGGDFGSGIAGVMTKINPSKIAGIHVNMIQMPFHDLRLWMKIGLGAILPAKFHFLSEEDQSLVYPFNKKCKDFLSQFGYFWMQSTRPNTIGIALSDSPAGLAAYILEKFAAWSNDLEHHLNSPNGGIEDTGINVDEMLTNVMIYYITNTISSSMRLYKEIWIEEDIPFRRLPVRVPAGLALFPNEVMKTPREFAIYAFRDIRQFTVMPRGGHFAALEEPDLLVKDILRFVNLLQDKQNA